MTLCPSFHCLYDMTLDLDVRIKCATEDESPFPHVYKIVANNRDSDIYDPDEFINDPYWRVAIGCTDKKDLNSEDLQTCKDILCQKVSDVCRDQLVATGVSVKHLEINKTRCDTCDENFPCNDAYNELSELHKLKLGYRSNMMNGTVSYLDGVRQEFVWVDYVLLSILLGLSSLIGVYFGTYGKKEDSTKEYLHGGKSMNVLPVALSLVSSMLSGSAVIGLPTETYQYGTLFLIGCYSSLISSVVFSHCYLPVYHELQVTSIFEYLELRFNKTVRKMASVLFTIRVLLYSALVLYVPALVFEQVSGWNVHIFTPVISAICIFYTMLGGLKAVVWTDLLQGVVMLGSTIALVALGVQRVGGFSTLWERNEAGGRIRLFELNPSPFERITFWSAVLGKFFFYLNHSNCQATVQKHLSLPTYFKAQISQYIYTILNLVFLNMFGVIGLLIYASYYNCDPLKVKVVDKPNKIVPFYAMDVSSSLPGLSGLFVAGVLSASLSTISSNLNAISGVIYVEFIKPFLKGNISQKSAIICMKTIVTIVGILLICIAYLIDTMGTITHVRYSLTGITNGAILGLFSLGLFFPRANSKGALAGSILSLLLVTFLMIGVQQSKLSGRLKYVPLPTRTDGCSFNETIPVPDLSMPNDSYKDDAFILFKVSFLYYDLIGTFIVLIAGMLVSLLTAPPRLEEMNLAVFTPLVRKYLIRNRKKYNLRTQVDKEVSHTLL